MDFNSRDTYLAARAQWKADYNQLSADIRVARREFNEAQRALSKHKYDWKAGYNSETNKPYLEAEKLVDKARGQRYRLRQQANEALQELSSAKEEARRQWEAAHRPVEV